ncbi:hypothetical protein O181_002831 [Austropuccinia psidii MF-1]|uniref:Uncharacterized protein n=1 Tax=Austropuccinia psidii MF-1 TaxID=1389203 RepID=A0A9Q3BDQ6_9BASI|nr:hypothetical protein [Austropuccinia psidii MF-1]
MEWLQSDPLIKEKLSFLLSQRSEDQYDAFKTTIKHLEAIAPKYNSGTTAEQKTAAIALLACAYESIKDPKNGLPLTPREISFLRRTYPLYTLGVHPASFPANLQRLSKSFS